MTYCIKKIMLFTILVCFIFTLTGCKKYKNLDHVYHSEIFNIDEDVYYIYVYRPQCEVCSSLEELVCKYAKAAKYNKNLPNLYVLNKGDGEKNAGIYCPEGSCNDFIGATSPSQVQTSTSPFLFKIRNGKVVKMANEKQEIIDELTI